MFKISVIDSRTVRRLVLEGTFITPWVGELKTTWATANADLQDRKLVLDLKNVTRISEEGEDALSELMREGATFSCDGVLTKHVLQQLARKSKKAHKRVFAPQARVRSGRKENGESDAPTSQPDREARRVHEQR
jgi:hypothetical protein